MDHGKLIEQAAKAALLPLGLKRQGRSRLWYDDHGWWAIAVEFQPSSWSRGSYLNVGVSWLLYEGENWTFDIGYREKEFRPADDDSGFEAAANDLATHAARRVLGYREQFSSLDSMRDYYRGLPDAAAALGNTSKLIGWPKYHAGILAGLAGDQGQPRNCSRR